MAKQIHYLIIATHLPSDSEILFFKTVDEAKAEFKKRTQVLFAVDGLEEDEDYWIEDEWAVRFNSGENEELSALMGDVNHYFKVGTQDVEDDCDCYVADFSEHVDEVMITFFNKQDAVNAYNNMVDGSIAVHNECSDKQIDRKNEETWEDEDYGTLFMESDNDDGSTDAFFGVSDVYWTYRIGKVTLTK